MFDSSRARNERTSPAADEYLQGMSEFGRLLGKTAVMIRLRRDILRAAPSAQAVLITGPTGAGKELVAQALHEHSRRCSEPFLDLNCGAIPEQLIESQLFGHERGSFTGADRRQEGYFSAVGGGTLFLDEIGELPHALQAKLLRVLETRRFRLIGSMQEQEFKGRIVAATHVDLPARIEQRQFREDLFYRLNVLTLRTPALSERRDDIAQLVLHFAQSQSRPLRFTPDALAWLTRAPWPGNVRELRHFVDRLTVFADDDLITPATLLEVSAPQPATGSTEPLADVARAIIRADVTDKLQAILHALVQEAMRVSSGNKSAAAKILGVHRKVVERKWFARSTLSPRDVDATLDLKGGREGSLGDDGD